VLTSVPLPQAHRSWRQCRAGQHWLWDGIDFLMLNPEDSSSASGNNQSCVLRISNGDYSVLLPGDIEKETEFRLLHKFRDDLSATVLVAPHHGSKTSSTLDFIDAVQPQLVLFPAGYRNRYRFPNQDIMRRYELRGSRSYDTGRDGAVLIRTGHSGLAATVWRRETRRFWHTVN
jgi:competence protein ComEC